MRKEKDKSQLLINILPQWKEPLKQLARIRSYQEEKTITVTDIIREAIWNMISGSFGNNKTNIGDIDGEKD